MGDREGLPLYFKHYILVAAHLWGRCSHVVASDFTALLFNLFMSAVLSPGPGMATPMPPVCGPHCPSPGHPPLEAPGGLLTQGWRALFLGPASSGPPGEVACPGDRAGVC